MEVDKIRQALAILGEALLKALEKTEEERVKELKGERYRGESGEAGNKSQGDEGANCRNERGSQKGNEGVKREYEGVSQHTIKYNDDNQQNKVLASGLHLVCGDRADGDNRGAQEGDFLNRVKRLIKKHEGFKSTAYLDSVGVTTIGYGRNLEHKGLNKLEAEFLLENDIKEACEDLRKIFDNFDDIPEPARIALIDMRFNLGQGGFRKFRKLIRAVKAGDYRRAAIEAHQSKWCRQVKSRCDEIVRLFKRASSTLR